MGAEIITNTKVGVDIPFETIRTTMTLSFGNRRMDLFSRSSCKGEDAEGVIGGIDFLKEE